MKCPLFGTTSGPCFTMLKPHVAYIYFQMCQSSESFEIESIRSKEYVYGVANFWDPFGPSLDQVGTMFSLPLLLFHFLQFTLLGPGSILNKIILAIPHLEEVVLTRKITQSPVGHVLKINIHFISHYISFRHQFHIILTLNAFVK